jgi:hypothetical protein
MEDTELRQFLEERAEALGFDDQLAQQAILAVMRGEDYTRRRSRLRLIQGGREGGSEERE